MKSRQRHSTPERQRGAAALVLAALMVVFCGTLAGTYYLGHQGASASPGFEQADSLRWAQEAVTGFAAAHGRLPCAASVRDGAENCAPGSGKGWLPVASIEHFALPPTARGRLQTRYMVYRGTDGGADPDLAVADEAFQPKLADGSIPTAYPDVVSSIDLCGKLRAASLPAATERWMAGDGPSGASARIDRANVPAPDGAGIVNVAFALSVAPIGTPDEQSGLNGAAGPHMESPYRAVDARYRDIVRVVDFASLFDTLSCSMTMASLDGLAVAASWTKDSTGIRKGNIEGSQTIADIEKIIVAAAGVGVVSTGLDLKSAVSSEALATALVATNTPLVPQPQAVVAVASGVAGQVTAGKTLALAEVDLVKGVAGAAVEAGNLVAYEVAGKKSRDSHVWDGATAVVAAADATGVAP